MIEQRITATITVGFVRLADGSINIDTFETSADFSDRNRSTPLTPLQIQEYKSPLTEQWAYFLEQELLPVLED